jgi:hypothetical protein
MYLSTGGTTKLSLESAGATFAGGITSSGTILTRNGTSPTSIQITNTYTSSTSFGLLDIRANAAQTAYEISSFLGSAGGANLPINIGHRDSAGTFTSGLSVATDGAVTASGAISCGASAGFYGGSQGMYLFSSGAGGIRVGNAVYHPSGVYNGTTSNSAFLYGISNASNSYTAPDLLWGRDSSGVMGVYTTPTRGTFGGIACGAITASGQITQTPPASVTLATNGQFSIEMTSNTAGNLVYRGSDGTTRRAALVFV